MKKHVLMVSLVACALLAGPNTLSAQTYNPYTGTTAAAAYHNPYTGTAAAAGAYHNPYTGTTTTKEAAYNPYTGARAGRSAGSSLSVRPSNHQGRSSERASS